MTEADALKRYLSVPMDERFTQRPITTQSYKKEVSNDYEEKTERVEKTIMKIIEEIKKIEGVKKEPQYLGISALDDNCVKYTISFTCPQERQWQIKRDTLKIIKTLYEKNKIKITKFSGSL